MMLRIGQRYLFEGQRYFYSGTVESQFPTHAVLSEDAQVHYNDVGDFKLWSVGDGPEGSPVPGQVVCLIGCDMTPIPPIGKKL